MAAEAARAKEFEDKRKDEFLGYLDAWNSDRGNWRFSKVKQKWLLANMYDRKKINKEHFKVLLKYLGGMTGQRREILLGEANKFISECEAIQAQKDSNDTQTEINNTGDTTDINPQPKKITKEMKVKLKRCRFIVQLFGQEKTEEGKTEQ
uniref:WKF domain-containing protein n=1 Tax=Arcella intermedia TaxID=1963864 RepID=A0A6B2LLI0_9EUKA